MVQGQQNGDVSFWLEISVSPTSSPHQISHSEKERTMIAKIHQANSMVPHAALGQ